MENSSIINHSATSRHRLSPQRTEECLQLTGSQMNLTSRSQKNVPRSPTSSRTSKSRPCSAFPCYNAYMECSSRWKRPMSADNDTPKCGVARADSRHSNFLGCSFSEADPLDIDPNFKHCYTYMSSNLLRSLIRNPWNSDCSESMSNSSDLSHSEKSLGCLIREMAQENSDTSFHDNKDQTKNCIENSNDFKDNDSEITKLNSMESALFSSSDNKLSPRVSNSVLNSSKQKELSDLKFQRWFTHSKAEEKIVRFSQEKGIERLKSAEMRNCLLQTRSGGDYNPENFASHTDAINKDDDTSCSTVTTEENAEPKSDYETYKDNNVDEICHYRKDSSDKTETDKEVNSAATCSSDCPFSCCRAQEVPSVVPQPEVEMLEMQPEKEESNPNIDSNDESSQKFSDLSAEKNPENIASAVKESTYDEIVTIINVLEQEETNSFLTQDVPEEPKVNVGKKNEQLHDIYSYLDEVEKSSQETINVAKSYSETERTGNQSVLSNVSSMPRLEDLLNKNTVDLAHEVLTLKLQIEDQSRGIKLLQKTIAEMKESATLAKSQHEDEIFKIRNDAETTVQRHQKFIKQLLQEKKTLNEKVGKLVEELKAGEERYQRNLKTIEQRHAIEIQRVKETQAVAEKLKREKWIDIKTQKIKEMTVKGLEPELSRMAARQQQEMTELRNLHRSELEAVELRATRRTTELLEQLRSELSKDKEETILRETNALRAKLEKQFEEERSKLEHELRKLREERRREKEILESKEAQMQDTYAEMKRALEREKERERQRVVQEFQEQTEALKRRHQNEIKSLRDTLEIEKEAWMNNYKKQQNAKFLEREAELHHQYKRERDKDIELVIERLESEATQAQQELTQSTENKLKRMKEKFDEELKEMEKTESALKVKLADAKAQLLDKDDLIGELKSQIHHMQSDMSHLKKLCEEMSMERSNVKEIIGKEFDAQLAQAEKEKEELRDQMATLKTNHIIELAKKDQMIIQMKAEAQQELNQVYNRVKITVSKKEEALEVLREQHKAVLERCSHLEKMLENQRRNLLLK